MNISDLHINELLDLSKTDFSLLFKNLMYPWDAIPLIKEKFRELTKTLDMHDYNMIKESVFVHKSVTVLKSVYLGRNIIIGRDADIRNSAFIRENAIIGNGAVLGNSCEIKNSILFDYAQCPHFNYIGDSIIGYKAHLGAGVITSNLKSDKSIVVVKANDEHINTGLKKFGAIVGDYAEIGCNSVLNPGSVIGRNTQIYPLSSIRGVIEANCIVKNDSVLVKKEQNNEKK
ncbi:MAG: UDP-N-acetylglucosamine pyrophosphorylase [Eubacteriales bacterium]|nr:UDP-N-acetylglucosamine pyrophosphorylase [Eubacteriales bacterium]